MNSKHWVENAYNSVVCCCYSRQPKSVTYLLSCLETAEMRRRNDTLNVLREMYACVSVVLHLHKYEVCMV